MNVVL